LQKPSDFIESLALREKALMGPYSAAGVNSQKDAYTLTITYF
jgi:hypothetical protein